MRFMAFLLNCLQNLCKIESEAEYAANLDEHAKELLADKTILAEIIQRLIPEFRGIPTEEIQTYINGTPYVSKMHINPGETNPSFEEAVRSLGQESRIQNEGLATFDILFGGWWQTCAITVLMS